MKTTSLTTKALHSNLLPFLFFIIAFYSGEVHSQVTVTSVTLNNTPATDCSNTILTVSGMHSYPGYTLIGTSFVVAGSNITVVVNYTQPGFGIPVFTPYSQTVDLGLLPPGSYSTTTNGQFNSGTTDTFISSLSVITCCPINASYTASSASLCVGDSIYFTNTSTGIIGSQSWYQNGSLMTNAQDYATQILTTGANTFKLVVNGSCSDSIQHTLYSYSYPTVDLGPDTLVCTGSDFVLDAGAGMSSYLWSTAEGSQTIVPNTADLYSVVVSKNGCLASDSINISLLSSLQLNIGADTTICTGTSIILDATAPNATYLWQDNSISPTFVVNDSGMFSVDIIAVNGCISTDSIEIALNPSPQINLGIDTIICIDSSIVLDATIANVTYVWQDNSTSSTLIANSAGIYSVSVLSTNGCTNSDSIEISTMDCDMNGIINQDAGDQLQIFPNPLKQNLNITVPDKMIGKTGMVKLFELNGSLVYSQEILSLDQTIKLTLPDVSNGFYLVQLLIDNSEWKSKVAIQK